MEAVSDQPASSCQEDPASQVAKPLVSIRAHALSASVDARFLLTCTPELQPIRSSLVVRTRSVGAFVRLLGS